MSHPLKAIRELLQELAKQAPPYGAVVAMTGPMALGSRARRILQLCNDAGLLAEASAVERLPVWRADAEWQDDVLVVKADLYDDHTAALKVELAEVREVLGGMLNSRNAYQRECERLVGELASITTIDEGSERERAFDACPDAGCDWGAFFLGWKAKALETNKISAQLEAAKLDTLAQIDAHAVTRQKLAAAVETLRWIGSCGVGDSREDCARRARETLITVEEPA